MSRHHRILLALPLLLFAGACDQIAVLDGSKARDADAVAVGSACRHSGRALEDCYAMYPESPKAQVFAGWKEMNDYMTSNKIEVIAPTLVKTELKPESKGNAKAEKEGGGHDAKPLKAERVEARPGALPPTSAAASNPLAGLPKTSAIGGEKAGADKSDAKGAPAPAPARH